MRSEYMSIKTKDSHDSTKLLQIFNLLIHCEINFLIQAFRSFCNIMSKRIVAVTGANRGLGLALVKRLLKESNYETILLCSRDVNKGKEVAKQLQDIEGASSKLDVAGLDMENQQSISDFCGFVKQKYGQVSAIVNNAGILFKEDTISSTDKFVRTAKPNLFGVVYLNDQILNQDLIQKKGKIVNLSSKLAHSSGIRDAELKEKVKSISSYDDIFDLYDWFLEVSKTDKAKGLFSPNFPYQEYSFLKLLLSKYTMLLSKDPRVTAKELEVYSMCPGWCKTDMGGQMASNTIESGTNVSYYLLNELQGINEKLQGKLVYKAGVGIDM